jgi:hypothetical protein
MASAYMATWRRASKWTTYDELRPVACCRGTGSLRRRMVWSRGGSNHRARNEAGNIGVSTMSDPGAVLVAGGVELS